MRRLVSTGDLLGIPVLDHIVIGDGRHFSFKEAGRMLGEGGNYFAALAEAFRRSAQ